MKKNQLRKAFKALRAETHAAQTESNPTGQMEPTLRPWRLGFGSDADSAHYVMSGDTIVATLDGESSIVDADNAELICRAVNNFDALVEALTKAVTIIENENTSFAPSIRPAVLDVLSEMNMALHNADCWQSVHEQKGN